MKKTLLAVLTVFLAATVALAQTQQPPQQTPPAGKGAQKRMGQGMRGQGMSQGMSQGMGPGMGMMKHVIYPPNFRPDMPFSPGVRVGGMLFVAGQIGADLKTGRIPDTFENEVRTAIENIGVVLKAAGMDYSDVVSVTVYLTDIGKIQEMNKVFVEYFKTDRPARATVQVAKLVGTSQVEISAIAHSSRAFVEPM